MNAIAKPAAKPANPLPRAPAPSARAGRWRRWPAPSPAAAHRASAPKARLAEVIERSQRVLKMPAGWRLGIVPASDTGAVEMALWSLLGARRVDSAGLGELRRRLGRPTSPSS
jgi:phosphoserine aminotransferase